MEVRSRAAQYIANLLNVVVFLLLFFYQNHRPDKALNKTVVRLKKKSGSNLVHSYILDLFKSWFSL